jgi:hypothetical protein
MTYTCPDCELILDSRQDLELHILNHKMAEISLSIEKFVQWFSASTDKTLMKFQTKKSKEELK